MEIELCFTEKHQKFLINQILKMPEEDLTKAYLIRQNKTLDEDFVFDYLENKYDVIVGYYIQLKDLKNDLIPSPKSASDWSKFELDYYKIHIVESDEKTMFGSEEISLSESTKEFLEFHTDEFLHQYKTLIKTPNFNNFSNFASAILEYKNDIEARVDEIFSEFLRSVCDKDFYVKQQVLQTLIVGKCEKDAISNISLKDMVMDYDGLVVVEDKSTKKNTKKLEAQLMAEGLAIAQQTKWNEKWTVYMISIVGLEVTFYTAIFPENLIMSVKKGFPSKNVTNVLKLKNSLDLGFSKERENIAVILKRIQNNLRKRR